MAAAHASTLGSCVLRGVGRRILHVGGTIALCGVGFIGAVAYKWPKTLWAFNLTDEKIAPVLRDVIEITDAKMDTKTSDPDGLWEASIARYDPSIFTSDSLLCAASKFLPSGHLMPFGTMLDFVYVFHHLSLLPVDDKTVITELCVTDGAYGQYYHLHHKQTEVGGKCVTIDIHELRKALRDKTKVSTE